MKEKILIKDGRLTPTMRRVRSGRNQIFTEGDIEVKIQHERKEMFAELIDGKWYWINGCAECNGKERTWNTYIECEEHDRCSVCDAKRNEIEGSVWGGSKGWTCNPCMEEKRLDARRKAFDKLDGELPDCLYRDEIICPHCGTKLSSADIYESQIMDCDVCEGGIDLEVEYSPTYSTVCVGERMTS